MTDPWSLKAFWLSNTCSGNFACSHLESVNNTALLRDSCPNRDGYPACDVICSRRLINRTTRGPRVPHLDACTVTKSRNDSSSRGQTTWTSTNDGNVHGLLSGGFKHSHADYFPWSSQLPPRLALALWIAKRLHQDICEDTCLVHPFSYSAPESVPQEADQEAQRNTVSQAASSSLAVMQGRKMMLILKDHNFATSASLESCIRWKCWSALDSSDPGKNVLAFTSDSGQFA